MPEALFRRLSLLPLLLLTACAAPDQYYWAVGARGDGADYDVSRTYTLRGQEDPGTVRVATEGAHEGAEVTRVNLSLSVRNGDAPLSLDPAAFELVTRTARVYSPADPPAAITLGPKEGRRLTVAFHLPRGEEALPTEFRFRWGYSTGNRTHQTSTAFVASPDPTGTYTNPFVEDRPFGPGREGDFWSY